MPSDFMLWMLMESHMAHSTHTQKWRCVMSINQKESKEFQKFDKAMDKIMSVSKAEVDKRVEAAKKAKTGKRFPKSA